MTVSGTSTDEPVVPSLTRWGLSQDADLVYRAVATRGPRTATTLARRLGLPPRRVADAVADLHAAGVLTAAAQGRWQTRPAADILARLRRLRRRASGPDDPHGRHRHLLDRLVSDRAVALGQGIRQLPDRQSARERLAELVAVERYEHLAINTEQQFSTEVVRAAVPLQRVILGRGISTRAISPPSPDVVEPRGPIRELTRLRVENRETVAVPLKLFLIDRRVALFPLVPHDHDRGFLEISQPPVVAALHAQFEQCWADALVPEENAMSTFSPSPREQDLILLLAQGHTDATAARELHIGTRSVTKMLRCLMDRLQVENRFQLGLALGALRVAAPSPRHHLPEKRTP